MKFSDTVKLGMIYTGKHKLRFAANTVAVAILLFLCFCLLSLIGSMSATADADMLKHLADNNNVVTVSLSGTAHSSEAIEVLPSEIRSVKKALSETGEVNVRENIVDLHPQIEFAGHSLPFETISIDPSSPPVVTSGQAVDANADGKIWIGENVFLSIKNIMPGFELEDTIAVTVRGIERTVTVSGTVAKNDVIFASLDDLQEWGALKILSADFSISTSGNIDDVKRLISLLENLNSSLVADANAGNRLSSLETACYESTTSAISLYSVCFIVVVLFLTALLTGILKTDTMINIADNIRTFSIMRCLGLDNANLMQISLTAPYLNIAAGCAVSAGATLSFNAVIKTLANKILSPVLFYTTSAAFSSLWWSYIIYAVLLVGFVTLYFSLTLIRSLKRKNLLQTLQGEA